MSSDDLAFFVAISSIVQQDNNNHVKNEACISWIDSRIKEAQRYSDHVRKSKDEAVFLVGGWVCEGTVLLIYHILWQSFRYIQFMCSLIIYY